MYFKIIYRVNTRSDKKDKNLIFLFKGLGIKAPLKRSKPDEFCLDSDSKDIDGTNPAVGTSRIEDYNDSEHFDVASPFKNTFQQDQPSPKRKKNQSKETKNASQADTGNGLTTAVMLSQNCCANQPLFDITSESFMAIPLETRIKLCEENVEMLKQERALKIRELRLKLELFNEKLDHNTLLELKELELETLKCDKRIALDKIKLQVQKKHEELRNSSDALKTELAALGQKLAEIYVKQNKLKVEIKNSEDIKVKIKARLEALAAETKLAEANLAEYKQQRAFLLKTK